MNIAELKEYIKDLPDDMEVVISWFAWWKLVTYPERNKIKFE